MELKHTFCLTSLVQGRSANRFGFVSVVAAVSLVGCFSRSEKSPPPPRNVDVLSFTPPAGWEITHKTGSGPLTMSDVNQAKNTSCQITVYNSLQSSGDLAADFFSEWTAIVGSPLPEVRDVSEENAKIVGVALAAPVSGQDNYVRLITYSAGARIASIVVLTPNLEAYESYRPQIDSFLAGVTVKSVASDTTRLDSRHANRTPQNEPAAAPTAQLSPDTLLKPELPLTQGQVDDFASFMTFVVGVKLTERERQEFHQLVIKDWNDSTEEQRKDFLEFIQLGKGVTKSDPRQRRAFLVKGQPEILKMLREDQESESFKWLLEFYEARYDKAAEAAQYEELREIAEAHPAPQNEPTVPSALRSSEKQTQGSQTSVNGAPQPEPKAASVSQLSPDGSPVAEAKLIPARTPEGTSPASDKSVWVAEWKKFIRLSDLSGKWIHTDRMSNYGTSTYWSETLSIRSDGSFTKSGEVRGGQTSSDEDQGTCTLSPRPMLKYAKGYSGRPFNILDFTKLPDGSATMSILDSYYPINEMNRAAYQKTFTRTAPEAAPPSN